MCFFIHSVIDHGMHFMLAHRELPHCLTAATYSTVHRCWLMCGNLGRYLHFALYLKLPVMPVIGLLCLGMSIPSGSVSRTWIGKHGVWFVRCLQIPSARVGPPCIPSHLLPYNRRCCPRLNVGQSHGHKTTSCCNFDFHFLTNGS